jgi:protein-disulfide isomerase
MAALNASKIALCNNDGKSDLLHFLFSNQKKWVIGETVEAINENLKKLLKNENIVIDFEKCTNNKNIEDHVLNDRIEGVKKFKVNATPTIIINNKKFDKPLNYKNLKKSIEKLI